MGKTISNIEKTKPTKQVLRQAVRQLKYRDLAEFRTALIEMHEKMAAAPRTIRKPPVNLPWPLNEFELEVLRQAPNHMIGLHYRSKRIAEALSGHADMIGLDEKGRVEKIKRIIQKLAERQLITRSRRQLQRLRTPTHEEIKLHTPLVSEVLSGKFRGFSPVRRWKLHFNKGEAKAICEDALIDGLATFEERKVTHGTRQRGLNYYLLLKMASKLADAVEQRERRAKKELLGRKDDIASTASEEKPSTTQRTFSMENLKELFTHHQQGKLNGREVLVLALRGLGHTGKAIGGQIGVTDSRVVQIKKTAMEKVSKPNK